MKTFILLLTLIIATTTLNAQFFTFGTIPDTQNLSETDEDALQVDAITQWYVKNKDSLNIKFVASLGDMTQWGAEDQWKRIQKSYSVFKKANLPFAPCQGNHDPTLDLMNKYFPVSEFEQTDMFGGYLNGIENAYYLFSENNMDFIVVVIQTHDQYSDNYDTVSVNWANKILNQYNNRHAIFVTHDFFEHKQLISDVITKHDNLFLALCGHSCAREQYWTETSPNGRAVNCIMADYQCDENKGATLRYYTFDFEKQAINAYTYNTTTSAYETDSNSQYSFDMPQKLLTKPVITSIANLPVFPKSNEKAEISATIFDKTKIIEATVLWGNNKDQLVNKTDLVVNNGKYTALLPAASDNTSIIYRIQATNENKETSFSNMMKYEICDDGSCLTCPFKLTETAFKDNIIGIPGKIEAENFNDGCQGISYSDKDKNNNGGKYRDSGVDISECNEGGFNVGWIAPGEWLKYRVNVKEDGLYNFLFRTSSHGRDSKIHIEVGGSNISGTIEIPNTGSWENWTTVKSEQIELSSGVQDLIIVIDEGEFNFNYFEIVKK